LGGRIPKPVENLPGHEFRKDRFSVEESRAGLASTATETPFFGKTDPIVSRYGHFALRMAGIGII
jgi:hypothetical protein